MVCRIIVGKMDKNKSGFVDKEELIEWIRHSTKRGIYEDTQKRWEYYDRDKSGDVHFDEWVKSSYSYMAGACAGCTKEHCGGAGVLHVSCGGVGTLCRRGSCYGIHRTEEILSSHVAIVPKSRLFGSIATCELNISLVV